MQLTLQVNGVRRTVEVEARHTLADVLRERCGLTGTHVGCEQGVCGACTVLLDGDPVRACLLFAVQCAGAEITTVEGLGSGERLHPVQEALCRHHGLQCGFCTPGFAVLLAGALARQPELMGEALRDVVAANLCRCTGYQSILAAAEDAARHLRSERSPEFQLERSPES